MSHTAKLQAFDQQKALSTPCFHVDSNFRLESWVMLENGLNECAIIGHTCATISTVFLSPASIQLRLWLSLWLWLSCSLRINFHIWSLGFLRLQDTHNGYNLYKCCSCWSFISTWWLRSLWIWPVTVTHEVKGLCREWNTTILQQCQENVFKWWATVRHHGNLDSQGWAHLLLPS